MSNLRHHLFVSHELNCFVPPTVELMRSENFPVHRAFLFGLKTSI